MFPFHQRGELSFQISNNHDEQDHKQQQIMNEEDQVLDYCAPGNITVPKGGGRGRGRGRGRGPKSGESRSSVDERGNDNSSKKTIHRDIERQRRQEMSNLYSSLRSILPLEYIKGKRSTSDHVGEAVNYINDLKHNIEELGDKRDNLKKSLVTTSTSRAGEESSSNSSSNTIAIHPCPYGLQIEIGTGLNGEEEEGGLAALSRVLRVLIEEGLNVVSCVSNKANDGTFHNIQTEASGAIFVDIPRLEWRLRHAISSG